MRTVTFGVANSLDNFIARKNGAVDWLYWSKDVDSIMKSYWKTIDTIVFGRKTYEVMVRGGQTAYPGMQNYVASRTLKKTADDKAVIIRDVVQFLRKLKTQ